MPMDLMNNISLHINSCMVQRLPWYVLWGVPQGSVLDPLVFSIYSEPICDMTRKYCIKIHAYADHIQLYLSFNASDDISECLNKMEDCVGEVREWMMKNMLFH